MLHRAVPAIAALSLVLAGCECGPPDRSCRSSADCRRGEACVDFRCQAAEDASGRDSGPPPGFDAGPGIDSPRRTLVAIRVEPPVSDLLAGDGLTPSESFRAIGVYSDGSEGPALGPLWSLDLRSIGELDVASGVFIANGLIGGTGTVTAAVPDPAGGPDFVGTAMLTVRLSRTLIGAGVPADIEPRFGVATPVDDPARSANVVYPLDGVVMPQNVYPADVQWTVSAPGDFFRITMVKPAATLTAYLAQEPLNHWLADPVMWRMIAQTEPDAAATLTVDRLEAATGQLVRGAPISMTFARAALTGSVYYWDIARGRIVRIDDGTATAVEVMPSPPLGCVGCHSVSNSGRYMAGRFGGGDNFGSVFDLTVDLGGAPPPTLWSTSSVRWWFSSWSPDDTRLVTVYRDDGGAARQLRFIDPFTGALVPTAGTMPNGTHPAWSPDGTRIAYATNVNSWGGEFTAGDLAILPVTAPDTVGTPTIIHVGSTLAGATPGGNADSYPTWSPDSAVLGFAHGTGARSDRDRSALYLMSPDASWLVRLDRASRGATGIFAFQPRFSPFQQGGYYWMSFLSREPYGNSRVGTGGAAPPTRQQIWVTAVRVGAPLGEDPSSVPYWLPGQRTTSQNISAYWAPRPCRVDGEACTVGSECCGGDCRPDATGALVCSPPPPDRCRRSGETCTTDADCCAGMGLTCLGHVCIAGPG
jgi:hypothetical protein